MYGYRKVHHDLLDASEPCAPYTVARIMRDAGLRAQVGYRRRPGKFGTKPAVVAANRLQQDFSVNAPDEVWVTDITYIRTHEGRLYLAAVIDLLSCKVVGWSKQPRVRTRLVLDALMMALWRRRPAPGVVIHSDHLIRVRSSQVRSGDPFWRPMISCPA